MIAEALYPRTGGFNRPLRSVRCRETVERQVIRVSYAAIQVKLGKDTFQIDVKFLELVYEEALRKADAFDGVGVSVSQGFSYGPKRRVIGS